MGLEYSCWHHVIEKCIFSVFFFILTLFFLKKLQFFWTTYFWNFFTGPMRVQKIGVQLQIHFSYRSKGLFIWDEASHLNEILFIPRLYEKNIPPEWDTFHRTYPVCLILSSYVTLIVYLSFCFYFNFELLIRFSITNFIRRIAFFHVGNNYKNKPSLN